jgi:hypothetical protein
LGGREKQTQQESKGKREREREKQIRSQDLKLAGDLLITELVTKVKPNINPVEVHPQLSHNCHPVDGALVGAGSLWPGE